MSRKHNFEVDKLGWYILIVILLYFIAIELKFILVPLSFSALVALLLIPLQDRMLRLVKYRLLSTILTVFSVLLLISAVLALMSIQAVEVFSNISNISDKVRAGLESVFELANEYLGFSRSDSLQWIRENSSRIVNAPLKFFEQGISSSAVFILNFTLTILGVSFMLYYKDAIKQFLLLQFSKEKKETGHQIIFEIQKSASGYLAGVLVVMLILALLNSFGLWLIGIDYPVFFGCLGALLAIIPYVGTYIGGLLPFLYAIATFDDWKGPLMVAGWYAIVQQAEGNFITPKVIGSNVRINFLVAFIALLIGGYVWGIAGIVLCLPAAAITKTIFSYIPPLKPVSIFMGDDILDNAEVLENDLDKDEHRLRALFRSDKK